MESVGGTTTISGFHAHNLCSHKLQTSAEVRSDFIRHRRWRSSENDSVSILSAVWMVTIFVTDTIVGIGYLHPNLFAGPRKTQADVISVFVLFQLIINYYKVAKTDSFYRSGPLEIRQMKRKKEWSYCLVCKHERPARCTHCFECKQCVLKRDHHCGIFRNCVGLFNTRYVIVFAIYMLYHSIASLTLIYEMVAEFHLHEIYEMTHLSFKFVCAIPFWSLGLIFYGHWMAFGLISLMHMNFVILALGVCYSGWMINLIIEGQTSYEALHDIKKYGQGWKNNVRQVFGTVFPIIYFVFPFNKALPSQGLDWEMRFGEVAAM